MTRHLLEVDDLSASELAEVLAGARAPLGRPLEGSGVALIMQLPSARTRNSTELAVVDLGGHPITLSGAEVGIDSRETAEDLARTLAQYHRVLCARVTDHRTIERMRDAIDAACLEVPVVNLLSPQGHPVQAIADLLTLEDEAGTALAGRRVAWVGDANNVARSFALAAVAVGMDVSVATPAGHGFSPHDVARIEAYAASTGSGGRLESAVTPREAVAGSMAVCTDVWVSMGQEAEREARLRAFDGFQVDEALLAAAGDGAVLLHCLPAHRGEEVSHGALEGPQSRVWTQVAHRRTAMRGLLGWLVAVGR